MAMASTAVLLVALALAFSDAEPVPFNNSGTARPNVALIAIDDLRPLFGYAFNHPEVITPHMDTFLAGGMVMQNSYVQVAVCGPSRSSLLTSRRPDTTHSVGHQESDENGASSWCWCQRGQFMTLPYYFRLHGYVTFGNGKIFHPDACGPADPHSLGDDKRAWTLPYFVEPECVQWGSVPCPHDKVWNGTMGDSILQSNLTDNDLTDGQLASNAEQMLAKFSNQGLGRGDNPFFMAVGFHKPHLPHIAPQKYFDMYPISSVSLPPNPKVPKNFPSPHFWYPSSEMRSYEDANAAFNRDGFSYSHPVSDDDQRAHRQAYFAASSFVDAQVGRVLAALDEHNYSNNTIVVLWSDHGWHLGNSDSWGKCTNFETGTRNTLMWRVPGQKRTGQSTRLVEMVDLFPTLAELALLPPLAACQGDQPPTVNCTQGQSYANEFFSGGAGKQHAFSQWPYNVDKESIMGYTVRAASGHRLTEYVKYDYQQHVGDWSKVLARELYDYNIDPHETVNHAQNPQYATIVAQLHKVLVAQFSS
eukprot:m.485386 g.485386  ORF g.485386 m.485386 type:complete len:530 (+) comp23798_c0_seq1:43-1632(+)